MSVLVIGAGGHGKVVVATLHAAGVEVVGILDDDVAAHGRIVLGVPVLGPVAHLARHAGPVVLGIGSNAVRRRIALAYPGAEWTSAVHPCAVVHPSVAVGAGTVVFAGAVVQPDAVLGCHAVVNTGATVDHDGRIGDFAHVAPGVHLSGDVLLGEGVFVGVGACAVPGVSVGAWTVVGAGAVVVRDLPPNVTAVGAPARAIKERPAGWHA